MDGFDRIIDVRMIFGGEEVVWVGGWLRRGRCLKVFLRLLQAHFRHKAGYGAALQAERQKVFF
jgi:hypothetical protein